MAKRPSTPVDEQPKTEATPARASARRAPGDGHLPGDDRAAPGRPREERHRAQRRRRRGRTDRARHPAPGRAGGHRRSLRALLDRHAGQDRPGRAAPGRDGPRDRPGPGPAARPRLHDHRARTCAPSIEELPDEVPDGLEIQALMRTVQAQIEQYVANGAPVPPEAAVAARNISEPGPAGRHGRLQPGHDHRAAPGAARDDRRRRAPQARLELPRPPGRDPRAQGPDPVRGQVRDGQDPARVHPARAAQGHPARAGRGRPAAGRDQRAARQGRGRRHAGRDQDPRDQGSRPDEPDPVRLARGRRHPDVRRLADRPALERLDRRPARHQGSRPDPRRGPLRPREDQGADPRVPRGPHARGRDPQPDPRLRRTSRRGQDAAWARASPGRWAASSCG